MNKDIMIGVRVDQRLYERVEALAAREDRSMSAIARLALAEYLSKKEAALAS